ncbi:Nitrate reductase delta subunit [Acididesulfobacillus acetoxydans]|uniref:Nitrate reductase delta subunit n=1 Tax=Acididesulfobacillus acetoxydans TaxID=1561005 RepID=A0A8S0W9G8_9FIRM|nr:Nitrate reductase delta subunit [Acididesulfobacillus acetoxydans]CEJ07264.1 Nitrate reductase delta subunit [Acididesulfobacillus acetoxydans]
MSSWWTPPEVLAVADRLEPGREESARELWHELALPGEDILADLFAALTRERASLRQEYERLFVGPGPVPCPPYEAVWHTDRPRHEEGMVTGEATEEVLRLYASLGLRVRSGASELPDHLAIELEALAYAWKTGASTAEADLLLGAHLACWLPPFCASVIGRTELTFYKSLATLTLMCVQAWAAERGVVECLADSGRTMSQTVGGAGGSVEKF